MGQVLFDHRPSTCTRKIWKKWFLKKSVLPPAGVGPGSRCACDCEIAHRSSNPPNLFHTPSVSISPDPGEPDHADCLG